MNKIATCNKCQQAIHLVASDDGKQVAVDPEITAFVPAAPRGGTLAGAAVVTGRRVHAELCATYQARRERDRVREEQRGSRRKAGL